MYKLTSACFHTLNRYMCVENGISRISREGTFELRWSIEANIKMLEFPVPRVDIGREPFLANVL